MAAGRAADGQEDHVPAYEARMQPQARSRHAKPMTEHHMFVPLVALWFGALFSLSSLAVRTGLFEQMIVSVGLDRLFPYASPPLGHTARLLIAAAFGLVGAGIGALLAKVVADGGLPGERQGDSFYPASAEHGDDYRVRARDAHPDAPARRPISASAELGEVDLAEDFPPSRVPAPWIPRVPLVDGPAEPETPPLPEWFAARPVEAEPHAEPAAEAPPAVPLGSHADAEPVVEAPVREALPQAEPVIAGAAGEVTDPDYPDAWRNTAERIAHAPPAALGHVELIERLALALNKRSEDGPAAAEPINPAPEPRPDAAATIQALREALSTLRGA
jgi:hypothetical protein